jgi:hypothetical protein
MVTSHVCWPTKGHYSPPLRPADSCVKWHVPSYTIILSKVTRKIQKGSWAQKKGDSTLRSLSI